MTALDADHVEAQLAQGLDELRTSGALPGQIPMVASASDVDTVVVGGRTVVEDGRHLPLRASGGVPRALTRAISRAWGEA